MTCSRRRPRAADRQARPDDRRAAVGRERRRLPVGRAQVGDGRRSGLPRPPAPDARRHRGPQRRARGARRARAARADEPGRAQDRARAPQGVSRACRRRARGRSRTGMSSSSPLDDWLAAVVATPGLTALRDVGGGPPGAARRLPARRRRSWRASTGAIVDVGSGGGAPGIPLAHAFPDREVVLLDAERRKCEFLESVAPANARVVWGRAEEQETDWAGVAVAKALAQPPTAAEWCLPLVRPGGAVVLWVGPSVDHARLAAVVGAAGGHGRGRPRRVRRDPQDRADACRVPAADGRRQEAAPRVGHRRQEAREAWSEAGFGVRFGR